MLSVLQALQQVLSHAQPREPLNLQASDALGYVLAEDIACDLDSPPWDKALMDGYAVQAADVSAPGVKLRLLEEVTAGKVATQEVTSGTCTRIMTGAPLPRGADAVVVIESTTAAGEQIEMQQPARPEQNLLRQGASMRQGEVVLAAGSVLRPIEIGLLAEVGRALVSVIRRPTVAILSTGDELVPAAETPRGGQIRNSNGPLLAALVTAVGATPVPLGIARDNSAELEAKIAAGLAHDVLLLSGGVSAGVLDLVPQALASQGVRQVFHNVDLKPGKPLWFGASDKTVVFGLPGNPVSTLVCFKLFVQPALRKLAGEAGRVAPLVRTAVLREDFHQRSARETYFPARLEQEQATPLAWQGSADLRSLAKANALLRLAGGERHYAAGESVEVIDL
jgi:molybdopterin molybdotransferase